MQQVPKADRTLVITLSATNNSAGSRSCKTAPCSSQMFWMFLAFLSRTELLPPASPAPCCTHGTASSQLCSQERTKIHYLQSTTAKAIQGGPPVQCCPSIRALVHEACDSDQDWCCHAQIVNRNINKQPGLRLFCIWPAHMLKANFIGNCFSFDRKMKVCLKENKM